MNDDSEFISCLVVRNKLIYREYLDLDEIARQDMQELPKGKLRRKYTLYDERQNKVYVAWKREPNVYYSATTRSVDHVNRHEYPRKIKSMITQMNGEVSVKPDEILIVRFENKIPIAITSQDWLLQNLSKRHSEQIKTWIQSEL